MAIMITASSNDVAMPRSSRSADAVFIRRPQKGFQQFSAQCKIDQKKELSAAEQVCFYDHRRCKLRILRVWLTGRRERNYCSSSSISASSSPSGAVAPPTSIWCFLILYQRTRSVTPSSLARSEEHTSELQSRQYLVCRLLLEK